MSNINQSTSPNSGYSNYHPDIIRGVRNNDFTEVQDALTQYPQCINKQDMYGRTAPMYAAMGRNMAMLEWLSKREGFDPSITDTEGNNMLHYAFWSGDKSLTQYIFKLIHPISFKAVGV